MLIFSQYGDLLILLDTLQRTYSIIQCDEFNRNYGWPVWDVKNSEDIEIETIGWVRKRKIFLTKLAVSIIIWCCLSKNMKILMEIGYTHHTYIFRVAFICLGRCTLQLKSSNSYAICVNIPAMCNGEGVRINKREIRQQNRSKLYWKILAHLYLTHHIVW